MPSKTVNLRDLSGEIKAFGKATGERLRQATILGVAQAIPGLVQNSPIDTGQYASSWDFTVAEKEVILGNFAPHAPIIEIGARPFTPPIGPLLAWAKRVLRDPSQPPEYSDDVWALAKGTQNKIARFGMEPKRIMENAIPGIIENIKRELERSI